jgi:nucleoporin POM152
MTVKDLAKGETYEHTVSVAGHTWDVDIPSHVFKSIGPHLLMLESVHDASGCEQTPLDPLKKSVWVDVAEAAAIVPYDPTKEHFCVGDVTQFQLEGTPPWTIRYRICRRFELVHSDPFNSYSINSKRHTKRAAQSPFALAQQVPGEFTIHSIAHQQKLCTTAISNLHYKVHPLPSAEVGHGDYLVSDLYEGTPSCSAARSLLT